MIREIMRDEAFLTRKAEPANPEDISVAQDLLDTLTAHKDGCVGMAANMIGINKRIIAFDNAGSYIKDVPADLSDTDVIIYGHSHKYACEERGGVLWLNPGSCGRRRFDQEITFAIMTVDNGHTQVEKVVIPHEKGRA